MKTTENKINEFKHKNLEFLSNIQYKTTIYKDAIKKQKTYIEKLLNSRNRPKKTKDTEPEDKTNEGEEFIETTENDIENHLRVKKICKEKKNINKRIFKGNR